MQDLINQLKEKFDLSDEKAAEILDTVIGTIREKLPEPIANKLESMLNGEGFDMSELTSSLTGKLPEGLEEKASGLMGKLFNK